GDEQQPNHVAASCIIYLSRQGKVNPIWKDRLFRAITAQVSRCPASAVASDRQDSFRPTKTIRTKRERVDQLPPCAGASRDWQTWRIHCHVCCRERRDRRSVGNKITAA